MKAERNDVTPPAVRRRMWAAGLAVAVVTVLAVGGVGSVVWRYAQSDDRRYGAVIARVAANDPDLMHPDVSGRIDLARRFPGVTPHDEMIYQPLPDGGFAALFPTSYGSGETLAGRLYASRPLTEADTYYRKSGMARAQRVMRVGYYLDLRLDRRINDHWYEVTFAMH